MHPLARPGAQGQPGSSHTPPGGRWTGTQAYGAHSLTNQPPPDSQAALIHHWRVKPCLLTAGWMVDWDGSGDAGTTLATVPAPAWVAGAAAAAVVCAATRAASMAAAGEHAAEAGQPPSMPPLLLLPVIRGFWWAWAGEGTGVVVVEALWAVRCTLCSPTDSSLSWPLPNLIQHLCVRTHMQCRAHAGSWRVLH